MHDVTGQPPAAGPWDSFSQALAAMGRGAVVSARPVSGGDINRALQLELEDGSSLFMKGNSPANSEFFRSEAVGLRAIASLGVIRVPRIFAWGVDTSGETPLGGPCSFLLLEYVPPAPAAEDYWRVLGQNLARLHLADCTSLVLPAGSTPGDGAASRVFGFVEDNFIGSSIQLNERKSSWVEFFRECRLTPQFLMARRHFSEGQARRVEGLLDRLGDFLPEPDRPSLLHGDLWRGNVITGTDGHGWLVDPAAYCGHWEADLAMTQLFGSFPKEFYQGYDCVNPIPKGFSHRADLYNLYHLMNHLNLFGAGYLQQVLDTVARFC